MGSSVGFVPPGELSFDFWGVVVKPGEAVKCDPGKLYYHISSILLVPGKVNEDVKVSVEVGGNRFLLGTLSVDNHPRMSTDLIFDKEFKLLHSSNTSSISFVGYKILLASYSPTAKADDKFNEVPLAIPLDFNAYDDKSKGSIDSADKFALQKQPAAAPSTKPKVKSAKNPWILKADDDSEESESDDDENAKGKKRAMETPLKTPPAKKTKIATPSMGNKTGGYVHVATPHPAKLAKTTAANSENCTSKRSGYVHVATPHPAKQSTKMLASCDKFKQSTGYDCKLPSSSRISNSPTGLEAHLIMQR